MNLINWRFDLEYMVDSFSLRIDVDVDCKVLAVFGPSGAGKSTLMELICGLKKPRQGLIKIGEKVFFDSEKKINIPARERHIGWVPQDASLFPHLSVRDNICYGANRGTAGPFIDHVIDVLNLGHTVNRFPPSLSGGEKQRVALARALASSPGILLLDEPLGSLDIPLRYKIFPYLLKVKDTFQIPVLYVSHDPNEVMTIADFVFTLVHGKLVNQGNPAELLAGLRGLSLDGKDTPINTFKVERKELRPEEGIEKVATEGGLVLSIPLNPIRADISGFVTVGAHDIILARAVPGDISAPNILRGTIRHFDYLGVYSYIRVITESMDEIVVRTTKAYAGELKLTEGEQVYLIVGAEHCHWLTTLPPKDPFV
ncbi:MAG: ATP-binding cassette domain-containing protein, partial [Dehalococcoidia bacterium]|nr:ATP-binding cassette domain-containing protein [Dehalococcoidia bacterium]MDZ4247343.1 ATP-binding cassette domain-containing protein [Dehalococcoidia bacterium]